MNNESYGMGCERFKKMLGNLSKQDHSASNESSSKISYHMGYSASCKINKTSNDTKSSGLEDTEDRKL